MSQDGTVCPCSRNSKSLRRPSDTIGLSPMIRKTVLILPLAAALLGAASYPEATISNGVVTAKFYLPDEQRGYYRGTRFDWSGQIFSLTWQGHEYFGQWFPRYDPKLHDAIMGPVEEFRSGESGLGYAETPTGGAFPRIGIGTVRKPAEPRYRQFFTYDIADPGKWIVRPSADRVEFQQELRSDSGYAWIYRKTVRLTGKKPRMVIEHSLKNTGKKLIETNVYDHNFFMIDKQPTGPAASVWFAFEPKAKAGLGDKATVGDHRITFLRELRPGESAFTEITGFGGTASDYDIRIENRKAGAGVHITGDHPLSKVVFWSITTTLCPEPYIELSVAPGKRIQWKYTYDFYSIDSK